jgi:outer membrane protein TolC
MIAQPLLRNFKTDGARTQLIISRKNREISDISLRQAVLSMIRSVKSAYMDLKYAKSALEVARQSLDLARESLRNNRSRVEIGTMAPIDIVGAQAEVALRRTSGVSRLTRRLRRRSSPGRSTWTAPFARRSTSGPTFSRRASSWR